jgi:carboxyl-terminal processing protease
MKRYCWTICIGLLLYACTSAQLIDRTVDNAFVITRMVAKYHVQPRDIDRNFSADLFNSLINILDDGKIYFDSEDINRLSSWKYGLDEQLLKRKGEFLKALVLIYRERIDQTDSLIERICKNAFNFNLNETYTVKEDSSFSTTLSDRRTKLYKLLKRAALEELLPYYESKAGKTISNNRADSLEKMARMKALHGFKREIQKILQYPGGTEGFVCNAYCTAVATCFDPHTEFFSLQEEENFNGQLGDKPLQFGFSLVEGKDGVEIAKLKPGSPAYKCGQINVGDRILTLQWETEEPVDVSDASPEEINAILSSENQIKLNITVKKSDGTTRKIILQKEKAVLDDDLSKVKSFLLKGNKTIGFISLPAFYSEWESGKPDGNGCADDVGKEIIKLKKEGIDALILDLRYNGGGSVTEAVALAGIFIDAGPVALVKDRDQKVYTLKDVNRGTIYDGPLLIMVNGFSASASEMFAAALQDYNRALIVGSPTYGKATAQIVLPLDTLANPEENYRGGQKDAFLKITISKLFRINGSTAQEKGVIPDIQIHDLSEAEPEREKNAPFIIHGSSIEPNKYYQPYHPLAVGEVRAYANTFIDTNSYFVSLKEYINAIASAKGGKDYSLQLKNQLETSQQGEGGEAVTGDSGSLLAPYQVQWHAFENERMKTDENLRFDNNLWKEVLLRDPAIVLSYLIASRMVKN